MAAVRRRNSSATPDRPGDQRLLERVEAAARPRPFLAFVATIGPGILVMLADTDAGNVVTAAQSGAQWGYRLLPLLLGLIPVLYMVQELAVRLGIFTGRGYSELVRHHYGGGWAWVLAAGLVVAVAGSMVTEFAAVAVSASSMASRAI